MGIEVKATLILTVIVSCPGIAYVFGLMLVPLVEHFDRLGVPLLIEKTYYYYYYFYYFNSDQASVSWVGSLLCGVYMLVGPIVGGLVNKFGCR